MAILAARFQPGEPKKAIILARGSHASPSFEILVCSFNNIYIYIYIYIYDCLGIYIHNIYIVVLI